MSTRPSDDAPFRPYQPSPGDLIDGGLLLIEEVGRGGMGTVWKAEWRGRFVAAKFALYQENPPRIWWNAFCAAALRRELNVLVRCGGFPLPEIYGHGEYEKTPYLLTDLLEGVTVASLPRSHAIRTWPGAARPTLALLDSLTLLHEDGWVMRDASPANILFQGKQPRHLQLRVIDLGLTTRPGEFPECAQYEALTVVGNTFFSAPEAWQGTTDLKSDLWSAAASLHFLLTDKPPVGWMNAQQLELNAERVPECVPVLEGGPRPLFGLPDLLVDFLAEALAESPAERFRSAREMKAALIKLVGSLP